ncbi:MAG: aminotransferase class V-fold PLP-dependent enzyme [Planctomycetes bacterium]|nr:aminotransferase class V-fold PLP-dependent enzyme [Planctomycetota bacterium]
MEWLEASKIPIGKWAAGVVDWMIDNLDWLFDNLALVLEWVINGILWVLQTPPPLVVLAIFAALKILGIGPGDEVIVPDLTFFGTASAVVLTGAMPVFADVAAHDFNIDATAAEACLSERTKAILPVHLYGQSCDLPAVTALAKRHNLFVVEDAAQAMGVTFGDRHVGTFGDIGCMSFFADKTMTTGEGGALLINDDDLADRCLYFKNQGRLKRGSFLHEQMGYNFRITDMQAAIGLAQFSRLDEIIQKKRRLRETYRDLLKDCPGVRFPVDTGVGEVVPFRVNILVSDPEGLSTFLAVHDIATRRFFYPLHRQPSFNEQNSVVRCALVNSVRAFETGLMLPSGLDLTETQIDRVCACVRKYRLSLGDEADSSSQAVATNDTCAVGT